MVDSKFLEEPTRRTKPAFILLIATIFVIASSFLYVSVVFALCSGAACNNTDPGATGCNADAATVRRVYPPSARVELRFSDACQTRWPRVWNTASLNYWGNAALRYWYYHSVYLGPGYSAYSNQRHGSGYQACGKETLSLRVERLYARKLGQPDYCLEASQKMVERGYAVTMDCMKLNGFEGLVYVKFPTEQISMDPAFQKIFQDVKWDTCAGPWSFTFPVNPP